MIIVINKKLNAKAQRRKEKEIESINNFACWYTNIFTFSASLRLCVELFSLLESFGLLGHFVNRADHVEGLLRIAVVFAVDDAAETADDVLQLLVTLQGHLHVARGAVVLLADDVRVHLAAG